MFAIAKIVAEECEWKRYAEDHHQESQHGGKGNSARRLFAPDEKVENKYETKQDERIESGCHERSLLPLNAT